MEAMREAGYRRQEIELSEVEVIELQVIAQPRPEACSVVRHIPAIQELRQEVNWAQLLPMALSFSESADGFVLDFPANRYNEVAQVVEQQLAICGKWIDLTMERKEDLILLTARATNPAGHTLLRSMTGLVD